MDLQRYRGEGGGTPRDNLKESSKEPGNRFVIQEHQAARFHFDFRLEVVDEDDEVNVLHSWIIPKNIPLEPEVRHLAIKADNKHLSFLEKDDEVVKGEFGEGKVKMWDKGKWGLMKGSIKEGNLAFNLFGKIIKARYAMQKLEDKKGKKNKNNWVIWRIAGY